MSKGTFEEVRERVAIAADPNTDPKVLDSLALDEWPQVKYMLLWNPSIAKGTLYKLAGSTDNNLRAMAIKRIESWPRFPAISAWLEGNYSRFWWLINGGFR
jgi:hypothetical protein